MLTRTLDHEARGTTIPSTLKVLQTFGVGDDSRGLTVGAYTIDHISLNPFLFTRHDTRCSELYFTALHLVSIDFERSVSQDFLRRFDMSSIMASRIVGRSSRSSA
jgi:hypothetical protein